MKRHFLHQSSSTITVRTRFSRLSWGNRCPPHLKCGAGFSASSFRGCAIFLEGFTRWKLPALAQQAQRLEPQA
jgi:hypothetical protein